MRRFRHVFTVALLLGFALPAAANEIRAIDGDTIVIDQVRYRLLGIAAPDKPKDAKDRATAVMIELLAVGGVSCQPTGRKSYNRLEARCSNSKGDLAGQMVSRGFALDWRKYSGGAYAPQENAARNAKIGLWSLGYEPTSNPNALSR
jgi:micrococcal nuclease|nr:thermonuclease family protein [uncultured Dongia sp.]